MKTLIGIAALTAVLASSTATIAADTSSDIPAVNGRWDAVLTRNGTEIPFRLDIKGAYCMTASGPMTAPPTPLSRTASWC